MDGLTDIRAGLAAMQAGRHEQAERLFRMALTKRPRDDQLLNPLAACLMRQGVLDYVLLEQARREAVVFRRADGWGGQRLTGEAVLRLASVGLEVPLAALCEGVDA